VRRPAGPALRAKRGDDANRRKQLVCASARLFREKGYDATSVRDIAAATGMQSGSWVYHFRTKQDILAAVMEQGLADALERIEAIAAQELEPREKFRALVRTHLENLLGPGQDFIPVLLYEWRSLDAAQRARVIAPQKRYERAWDEVIRELQESGDWAVPTRADRLLMFGALNWIAHWYRSRGELSVDELADECVRFFLRTPEPKSRTRAVRSRPPARKRAARR
jgi:TetR/AcrR family transcriptional regulator, cholesterol catabolism regulator